MVRQFLVPKAYPLIMQHAKEWPFLTSKRCAARIAISSILFSIYINPLLEMLNTFPGIKAKAYADNILLLATSHSSVITTTLLAEALRECKIRGRANEMKIAYQKTELCTLDTRKSLTKIFQYNLEKTILLAASRLRYLSVWLDPLLSWREHFEKVIKKANYRLTCLEKSGQDVLVCQQSDPEKLLCWRYTTFDELRGSSLGQHLN